MQIRRQSAARAGSCLSGQLPELHAEIQHLSGWLAESCQCVRGTACVFKWKRGYLFNSERVMSDLKNSALIKSSDTWLSLFIYFFYICFDKYLRVIWCNLTSNFRPKSNLVAVTTRTEKLTSVLAKRQNIYPEVGLASPAWNIAWSKAPIASYSLGKEVIWMWIRLN